MKTATEGDDRLTTGRLTCQLDRALHRLGAAVPKECGIESARRDRRKHLRERDVRLVLRDAGGDVHEPRGLLGHRLDHARMRMSDDGDRDPAGEIQDAAAIRCDEPASFAAIDLQPGVVPKDGREDFASSGFEVSHRDHSIG